MSVLTNTDLRRILCYDENQWHEKPLLIEDGSDDCITPMGYDLRYPLNISGKELFKHP